MSLVGVTVSMAAAGQPRPPRPAAAVGARVRTATTTTGCRLPGSRGHVPVLCRAHRRPHHVSTGAAAAGKTAETVSSEDDQIRIPQSIADIDNGKILGFGADLGVEHPGFNDETYKKRRMDIVGLAAKHELGEPIPSVEYTADELRAWGLALRELKALYPTHACAEFLRNWELFNFREDEVPQLEAMSETLRSRTGWQIRPVAGLLHPRDFLNGLAFKTFHSTQYMRHHSQPMYTPEPDVIHELLGHVVMLADPAYCKLVETIGRASLGASEKEIWHLTKVYWYTVEFGVVMERDQVKAFGAGILSSFGELQHMRAGHAKLEPFDPFAPQPKMSYKDGFQSRYFVMDSFERGCQQLTEYAASMMK